MNTHWFFKTRSIRILGVLIIMLFSMSFWFMLRMAPSKRDEDDKLIIFEKQLNDLVSNFNLLPELPRGYYINSKPFINVSKAHLQCDVRPLVTKADLEINTIYDQLAFDDIDGGVWKQGYPINYTLDQWSVDAPLEVFIVPHSHQDPGWLQTYEGYFETSTRKGLDATLQVLTAHNEARFIYAEIAFFSKWFDLLSQPNKQRVKRLLDDGVWEISSGGWVMNDEANTHYYAMIDQLTEGQHWLLDNLDYRPNTSWVIDPFGQSTTMAYLIRKMGVVDMIINRVHYEVKKFLSKRHSLEFRWQQTWDTDRHTEVFAHLFPFFSYDIPHTCGPEPAICCQFDFWRLHAHGCPWHILPQVIDSGNIAERAAALADQYRKKATLFKNAGLVLIPLGDDFRYLSVNEWMVQLDNYNKIIDYLNSHPEYRIHVRFATVSDYFTALHKRFKTPIGQLLPADKFPSFHGDMFTYSDLHQDYWSGYFTSRPVYKRMSRVLEADLRSAELLYSYARHTKSSGDLTSQSYFARLFDQLTVARRNLGLFQHHDGITGTARPPVVQDYSEKLIQALDCAHNVSLFSVANLLGWSAQKDLTPPFELIPDAYQPFKGAPTKVLLLDPKGSTSSIYLFNPLAHPRTVITTLLVTTLSNENHFGRGHVLAKLASDHIPTQLEPLPPVLWQPATLHLSTSGGSLADHPHLSADNVAVLRVGPIQLSPLGLQRVEFQLVQRSARIPSLVRPLMIANPDRKSSLHQFADSVEEKLFIQNDLFRLDFKPTTGFIEKYTDLRTGQSTPLMIDLVSYEGPTSGAYLFNPNGDAVPIAQSSIPRLRVAKGKLTEEITIFLEHAEHTVRVYRQGGILSRMIEVENVVHLPQQTNSQEYAMRIRTQAPQTTGKFYTDANCFQFMERRPNKKIPLGGNVYPMSCAAYTDGQTVSGSSSTDSNISTRLTLLSWEPLGVANPKPGEMQVWLDRRLVKDDERGLQVPLTDTLPGRTRFRLLFEQVAAIPEQNESTGVVPSLTLLAHRLLQDLLRPIQHFSHQTTKVNMANELQLMPGAGLPCDYELVSMKTFHSQSPIFQNLSSIGNATQLGVILHRLAHFCAVDDPVVPTCPKASSDGSLELSQLFGPLEAVAAQRVGITLIPATHNFNQQSPSESAMKQVRVKPMELDAFLLQTKLSVANTN